jgi:shikimate kinase
VGRHLVLVGLMGVGKTTVGRVLAERLGRRLYDSDLTIEAATGRTVKQILADGGLEALRRHEAAALFDALDTQDPAVIAAAAGIVLDADHRRRLAAADADVVWLTADPASLAPRTATREHRPWLEDDPLGTLRRMERERAPLYREVAARVVLVDDLTPDEIADRIVG